MAVEPVVAKVQQEQEVAGKVAYKNRDSGHESSSSGTPDAERALTPDENKAVVITASGEENAIPEAIYILHIEAPSGNASERFDVQVNNTEMIQEIHQVLLEREATCHRTCFSLQLDGKQLDHFSEIRNVPGLKSGATLHVVEEPYTLREARIHIRHVRDLARIPDAAEAASAVDLASLSFLVAAGVGEPSASRRPEKGASGAEKQTSPPTSDGLPPDSVLPGSAVRPLSGIVPTIAAVASPATTTTSSGSFASTAPSATQAAGGRAAGAVRNITLNPYNPPLSNRKLKGDVLYIDIETAERRLVHVTCCTAGFFVNATEGDKFRPQPATPKTQTYHSLVDLLSSVSPAFKKNFASIVQRRSDRHILDRLPTPYPTFSWLSPGGEAHEDSLRAEDATQPSRIGIEDHLPGQIRDWNEELQVTNEMPKTTLHERIIRDRSIFKIHSDFIAAAIKGAQAIVEGNVMAINPADEPKTHMFIWNNIFFSLGFDVKDHYKEIGGDAAAFAATTADLAGVRAYWQVDSVRPATLGMAIIDYRGQRVTAQSIIPGILEREQEQSVVYGSIDFGKTVVSHEKYHELLEETAKELHMLPHEVWNGKEGEEAKIVKLYTSFETKGIIGNDSRYYVLDLLRTMPPDVHFLPEAKAELSEAAKKAGFPRSFPHKLVSFRKELVDSFYEFRYVMFLRIASYHMQMGAAAAARRSLDSKEGTADTAAISEEIVKAIEKKTTEGEETQPEKEKEDEENDEAKEAEKAENKISEEALAKAAEAVHSLRPDSFDVRFNADCFSETIQHAETEDIKSQRHMVVELGEFLLTQQIPSFVLEAAEGSLAPIDGEMLAEQLHARGVNMRYLGHLLKTVPSGAPWLRTLVAGELVARCVKHVFRSLIHSTRPERMAAGTAHVLSALLAAAGAVDAPADLAKTKKGSGKKQSGGGRKANASQAVAEWEQLSQKSLWKAICNESSSYYGYELELESADELAEKFNVQKVSLLRRVCRAVGIQLLAKDYALDAALSPSASRSTPPPVPAASPRVIFVEDDIQNIYPVTKHRKPIAVDAKRLFTRGQQEMQAGRLREAYEYITEAVNMMTSVYGAMHGDLAAALRLLAKLSYILGEPTDGFHHQHRATIMSERCYGLDHANTILEYVNLAHLAFANLMIGVGLRLLYRARSLLLVASGEQHPFMAQIDGNIGVMLYAVQEFELALRFLQSADAVAAMNGETKTLKNALLHHIMARAHSCRGDFRTALVSEKETCVIYNLIFGPNHEKTLESNEYLRQLTQQAVTFQRRMQDASRAPQSIAQLLPISVQQPSLASILDVLNILNGIIVIQVSSGSGNREEASEEKKEGVEKLDGASVKRAIEPAQLEEETLD